ncbi:hypothetical protein ACOACO_17675 [Nocardioides sp. CPCC 205120]|uniref:hypothetical protein n=1 Tax=Nocardioides sp. CPCC 205120 TaxID=3406462 RepID=UPI003B50C7AA
MSRDTGKLTKAQVRAAVEEHEERVAIAREQVADAIARHFDDDEDDGTWSRNAYGDVRGLPAFNRHMDQVGEEDQSALDWSEGA